MRLQERKKGREQKWVWVGYNRISIEGQRGKEEKKGKIKRREKEKEGIRRGIWIKGREDDRERRGVKGERERERGGVGRDLGEK